MSDEPICKNCRAYDNGYCKHDPPVALRRNDDVVESFWPEVFEHDFCLQFERKG